MLIITSLLISLTSFGKALVISDIDDTIKVTNVASPLRAIGSAFDDRNRFAGMSELYQVLQHKYLN